MEVVVITSYEDHKQCSGPTAIIKKPEGVHEDDVFLKWLQQNDKYWSNIPKEQCLRDSLYGWKTMIVEEVK